MRLKMVGFAPQKKKEDLQVTTCIMENVISADKA